MNDDLQDFLKDRKEALLSMDRDKINAYLVKYGGHSMEDASEDAFWCAIHKARTGDISLPMEARSESKKWLTERGFTSMDDGDVP